MQLPLTIAGASTSSAGRIGVDDLLPLAGLAVAGLASHFCLTSAFRAGDATIVVPLDFLRVPLIAVVGATFYREPFDPFVLAGAALIVAGILCNLRAEAGRV